MAKEKVYWGGMAGRAVRYADMDRWAPRYSNIFAYQGVSRSARPADPGQRDMCEQSENLVHLAPVPPCDPHQCLSVCIRGSLVPLLPTWRSWYLGG